MIKQDRWRVVLLVEADSDDELRNKVRAGSVSIVTAHNLDDIRRKLDKIESPQLKLELKDRK